MAPPGRQFGPSFMKKKEEEKFSLRGCRVPSKAFFTAKHLTVFGLFRIALSKRRGEKQNYFGLSSGFSFGIFVPLAFSFAQLFSSHFLFWFSLGRWIPSFFAKKMPSLFG